MSRPTPDTGEYAHPLDGEPLDVLTCGDCGSTADSGAMFVSHGAGWSCRACYARADVRRTVRQGIALFLVLAAAAVCGALLPSY